MTSLGSDGAAWITTIFFEFQKITECEASIRATKIQHGEKGMNYGIVSQEQIEQIDAILTDKLIKLGVDCVIVIDMAGNIITAKDNSENKYDVYSFAALAAGNFATVDAMAKLVGEEEFSLLFHKGQESSIHFSKIDEELLLISMFGQEISLGFLRLNVVDVIEQIKRLWNKS